jgi:alpha-D-xyloside xylohydrolase
VYRICEKYIRIREKLRPYIRLQMHKAHVTGEPVMRPVFYDFPMDSEAWEISDQYMFGPIYLIAPILHAGQRARKVYLPTGSRWESMEHGEIYEGGQWIEAAAPLDTMPVFIRGSLA